MSGIESARSSRDLRMHRLAWRWLAMLAAVVLAAAQAAPPTATDRTVGTFQRLDEGSRRLVLNRDSKTGSGVGQSSPIHLYYDDATQFSRDGATITAAGLQPGQRLLVDTSKAGNRVQAKRVYVLASTTPGQTWGGYLHGTIKSVETGSRTVHIDQADTMIFNRINNDEQTTLKSVDGKVLPVTSLKTGDEVDMSVKMRGRLGYADRVVLIRPGGNPPAVNP